MLEILAENKRKQDEEFEQKKEDMRKKDENKQKAIA